MDYQIIDKPVPNFESRYGNMPLAIVDHIMQGTLQGTYLEFTNNKVSAHFGVGRDGTIWRYVAEENTAWANGPTLGYNRGLDWLNKALDQGLNPNWVTLSIEHEGWVDDATGQGYAATQGGPYTPFPEQQYQATLWLHRYLLSRYPQITVDRTHIVGHYQIDPGERSFCPGANFPFDRLIADLTTPAQVDPKTALVSAVFAAAGFVYHADWAAHQAAVKWNLGAPLAADTHVTVNNIDYVAEVYTKDVIYYPSGQWANIQRLSALPAGDPLRPALWQLAYTARQIPMHPDQAFYQYADTANAPGGTPIGMPLTDSFRITDIGGNSYVAQVFALDTIFTPLANPEANTNWSDIGRLSSLTTDPANAPLVQTITTAVYKQLQTGFDPGDPLYQKGAALGYGVLLKVGQPFTAGTSSGTFDLFGGGVIWRLQDGTEGTLDTIS